MDHGEERLPAKALLELLPPIEDAPILEHLARVGLKVFEEEYATPTPQDDEGLIDHKEFITDLTGHVTNPNFRWNGSVYNKHHLFFYKRLYRPEQHNGDDYPYRFRELVKYKLWEPKQLHIFGHVVKRQPRVPSLDTMHRVVDEYEADNRFFGFVEEALRIEASPQLDRTMKRRYGRVIGNMERYMQTDKYPHIQRIIGTRAIEDSLRDIQRPLAERLGRTQSRNNAVLVRVPTRRR